MEHRAVHGLAALLLCLCVVQGVRADNAPRPDQALRAVLEESKDKGRGVTVHVNGTAIALAVLGGDGAFVTGRSQHSSRIVIRIERIDAVVAQF